MATLTDEGYYVIVCHDTTEDGSGNRPRVWVLARRDNEGDDSPFFFTEDEAKLIAARINADVDDTDAEVAEWYAADPVGLDDAIDRAVAAALAALPVA